MVETSLLLLSQNSWSVRLHTWKQVSEAIELSVRCDDIHGQTANITETQLNVLSDDHFQFSIEFLDLSTSRWQSTTSLRPLTNEMITMTLHLCSG